MTFGSHRSLRQNSYLSLLSLAVSRFLYGGQFSFCISRQKLTRHAKLLDLSVNNLYIIVNKRLGGSNEEMSIDNFEFYDMVMAVRPVV